MSMVLFAIGITFAQRSISGTITDSSGETLIGASILVKGSTTGTVTDFNGKYQLNIPMEAKTLVFSYTGFETQEIDVGVSNVMDIVLAEGVTLKAAVVTALGIKREEKSIGYSVQEVSSEDISKANTVNMIDALSGRAAGVQVTQSSGAAGASSRIVLRGQTSFNGKNQALIVVDGIRMDNTESNSERGLHGVANSSRGMDINPNDVASVTVLKGAAATALYGIEGARGVILITTKKAEGGAPSVEFSTNYTASKVNKLHEMQKQYSQGGTGSWYGADDTDPVWWGGFVRALSWGANIDTLHYDGSDYKWDKRGRIVGQSDPNAGEKVTPYNNVEDFFQTGSTWTNSLAITGGEEKLNYRFSFGRTDQNGIVPKNNYQRTNLGVQVGAKLWDKLKLSTTLNYSKSVGYKIQQGSNTSGVMLGLLRTPVTFDNANGLEDPVNDPSSYSFPDASQRNFRGGGGYDNPYWVINNTPFTDVVSRLFGSVNLAYEFSPWATLSTTIGSDFYTDNRKQKFELGSNTFPGGQVVEDQFNYRHTDVYFNLLGGGSLGDNFSLSYNLGVNLWDKFLKNNYVQGDGLNFPGFVELGNTQSVVSAVSHSNERSFSTFGSVDFGFKNFLYLTLTGRNDWVSSLIVPGKEFNAKDISVFYPSASLSLVFSELVDVPSLSFGKLRASYAQVGGGAPASYLTGTIYNVPNNTTTVYSLNDGWTNGILFPYKGLSGYTYSPVQGNVTLIPATTTDLELGLDLRFFNNRVGLDATYYTRESKDQIIAINIPASTGFQRTVINSGELKTVGGEVVLNITPVKKQDFTWDISFNFSKWKTTVESLPEGVPNQYVDGFTGTGIYNIAPLSDGTKFEYGQIRGGAFQHANDTDANGNAIFNANADYNPDGALIIDDSGSPDPDADDFNPNFGFPLADPLSRVIGNPNPDFLLGINNNFSYKGFNLSFLIDIKKGGEIWNGTKGALTFFGRTQLTEDRAAMVWNDNQGWVHDYSAANHTFEGIKASDGSSNDIAVPLDENWYTGNGGGFGSVDEHFVEDASYTRLRYVSLSYNLSNVLKTGVFKDLTLSVTGRNLLLITDYTGVDPETSLIGSGNGQGLEYFQMPGTKSYAVGLNAKF